MKKFDYRVPLSALASIVAVVFLVNAVILIFGEDTQLNNIEAMVYIIGAAIMADRAKELFDEYNVRKGIEDGSIVIAGSDFRRKISN